MNEHVLPKDVKVVPFYDRSDLIALTTRTVADNLVRGILLVVVVLIFFLYDVRSGLIVAATIPLALLIAFICLDLRGIPANLLSIGAIDFGILVDGAVVMVENIHRQLGRRHGTQYDLKQVIVEAAVEGDWARWLGDGGEFVGMTGFGASAPAETLYREFGITEDAVAKAALRCLARSKMAAARA